METLQTLSLDNLKILIDEANAELRHRQATEQAKRIKRCNELLDEIFSIMQEDEDLYICGYNVDDNCEVWCGDLTDLEVRHN